jgi:CcmD family protein
MTMKLMTKLTANATRTTTTNPRRAAIARLTASLAALLVLLAAPALALAQEFQKVEGRLADEIPAVPFVGIAYGFIWIAVLGYVLVLGKNLGRINGEVEELRRKIDAAAGPSAAREAQRR